MLWFGSILDVLRVQRTIQQDVGEDGALHELEPSPAAIALRQDLGAGDVGRHQIRCELNPLELEMEDLCDRAHQQRLGHAGHAFNKRVVSGKYCNQCVVNHMCISDDNLGDFLLRSHQCFFQYFRIFFFFLNIYYDVGNYNFSIWRTTITNPFLFSNRSCIPK